MIKNVKNFAIRLCLLFISIIGLYFCNNVNADSLVQTWRDWYGNSLWWWEGEVWVSYNNFWDTSTIGVNSYWSLLTNWQYQVLELSSAWNGRRSVQMFWNKNGDINWINWRKLILNSGWCYSTNAVVWSQCPSYDLTINDIKSYFDSSFVAFSVQSSNWQTPQAWYSYWFQYFCLYDSDWSSFCVKSWIPDQYNEDASIVWLCGDSLWCSSSNFESFYWSSPFFTNNNGGWSNSLIYKMWSDLDNTIAYFENEFGWNKNLCYVGTNDLTSPYGTAWISFEYWSGGTIYSLYYSLYNSYWSNRVQNVWRFINTWLINYSQWFATAPSNRLYLASYDWPWSNVSLYYTWLTFPYSWKPVAIYFMSDLLYNQYSRESTQWEQMAYYCYLKLNYVKTSTWSYLEGGLTFEDVQDSITPWIVWRINDSVNSYLSGRVWFLVPDYSWSVWGDVTSWSVFDWDVDPSNTFESFYNDILWIVNRWNYTWSWILPPWIIYPLLFLILFRILKH